MLAVGGAGDVLGGTGKHSEDVYVLTWYAGPGPFQSPGIELFCSIKSDGKYFFLLTNFLIMKNKA